jgi:hypothetical protein
MIKGDFFLGGGYWKKEAWGHEEWAKAGSELVVNLVEVATLLIKPNGAWLEGYLTIIYKPRELFWVTWGDLTIRFCELESRAVP